MRVIQIVLCFSLYSECFAQGWSILANTDWQSHTQADAGACSGAFCSSANFEFRTQAPNMFNAWNGAAYDSRRHRVVTIAVGGHNNYNGNQVMGLDFSSGTATLTQLVAPSAFDYTGGPTGVDTTADGHLTSRHTYGCEIYLPSVDKYFVGGGVLAPQTDSNKFFLVDPVTFVPTVTATWGSLSVSAPSDGMRCDLAPWLGTSGSVLVVSGALYFFGRYDIATNAWSNLTTGQNFRLQANCPNAPNAYSINLASSFAIDPDRQRGYLVGTQEGSVGCQNMISTVDLSGADPNYYPVNDTANWTGCAALAATSYPAIVWYPPMAKLVGYTGTGGTVYIMDPITKTCVPQAYSGGPVQDALTAGPFNRFLYLPEQGFFVACMDAAANCQKLSLGATVTSGLGSSTLTCLDLDGDGYGVGPGCMGPDADDQDGGVHTSAQFVAKWSTLALGLNHLGYNPANIWYIAATGNDGTGAVNNVALPFLTCCGGGKANPSPGDAVLLRGGTYTGPYEIITPTGTAGHPIVFMAYPGELPYIHNVTADAFFVNGVSYVVIDGIKTDNGLGNAGCIGGNGNANVIIRRVEVFGCYSGIMMFDMNNMVFEQNLSHDMNQSTGQHGFYLGSHAVASTNVLVRQNISYRPGPGGWPIFQWNGRVTNLIEEQNLGYSAQGTSCYAWLEGVSKSFLRTNLCFDGGAAAFALNNYPGDCSSFGQGGSDSICPYDQTGNLIENNTFWEGPIGPDGVTSSSGVPAIQVSNAAVGFVGDLGSNTYRNNIFVGASHGGTVLYPSIVFSDAGHTYLSTSTFDHNVFWSSDGTVASVIGWGPCTLGSEPGCSGAMFGYSNYTCAGAAGVTTMLGCINADPKFVAASTTFWNSPASFNLRLLVTSPGYHAGSAVQVPTFDLLGLPYAPGPSLGAYDAGVGATATVSLGGTLSTRGPVGVK